jgi:CheY-like chemotaxis protein
MSLFAPPSSQPRPAQQSRVLILDSDRQIRALVSEWLELAGYWSMQAYPRDVTANAASQCDIVLIDVRSPLQSARQAIDSVRTAAPHVSIVAMSADALASGPLALEEVARELGVAAVLVKPFDRDALMQALWRARAAI